MTAIDELISFAKQDPDESTEYTKELGAQAAAELARLQAVEAAAKSGNGWKKWAEAGGGYKDAFLGWLKEVNALLEPK